MFQNKELKWPISLTLWWITSGMDSIPDKLEWADLAQSSRHQEDLFMTWRSLDPQLRSWNSHWMVWVDLWALLFVSLIQEQSQDLSSWMVPSLKWINGMMLPKCMEKLNKPSAEKIDTSVSRTSLSSTSQLTALFKSNQEMPFRLWLEWNGLSMSSSLLVVLPHSLIDLQVHSESMPLRLRSLVYTRAPLLLTMNLKLMKTAMFLSQTLNPSKMICLLVVMSI